MGHSGYVTDLLAVFLEGDEPPRAPLRCGPAGDAGGGRAMCAGRGSRPSSAMEAPMACGFGACFGCAVPAGGRAATCGCAWTPRGGRGRDRDRAGAGVGALDGPERRALRASARASGAERRGTFDAIAARRAFGDALVEISRSPRSSPRRSPPSPGPETRRRGSSRRRPGWSTRSASRTRASRGSRRGPARLAEPPGAAGRLGDGHEPRIRSGWSRASRPAPEVAALELNVSCPNVESGLIVGQQPDGDPGTARGLRPLTARPLIVKLTPNVAEPGDGRPGGRGRGRRRCLADQHVRASALDPRTLEAWLGAGGGGLSGPAIRRPRLDQVRRVAAAVSVPVIGMGGIESGADALAFLAAGATAVAVGTANFRDPMAGPRPGRALGPLARRRPAAPRTSGPDPGVDLNLRSNEFAEKGGRTPFSRGEAGI